MSKIVMDERYMLNVAPVENALELLREVTVARYNSMDATGSKRLLGVVGQTAKEIPEAVEADGLGAYRVDLEALVPLLLAAIQELDKKVNGSKPRAKAKPKVEPTEATD